MEILVTGATGFVGRAFVADALKRGWKVRVALRREGSAPAGCTPFIVGDIDGKTDWKAALAGCTAVVHLAARVHMMNDTSPDALANYYKTNTDGTGHLAAQALAAGVSHFIFMSTIKVNGEGKPTAYVETDTPEPSDPYAISKWEGEKLLAQICAGSTMAYTVIRPPLVYGAEVRANFLRLMQIVKRGIPLPFGKIENHRSFIYVHNLTAAIIASLENPNARNKTFLVADEGHLSTPGLIRSLALAMKRPTHLLPVPVSVMQLAARLLNKTEQMDRLTGSLYVDTSAIRSTLNWKPPFTTQQGLADTVAWFLRTRG